MDAWTEVFVDKDGVTRCSRCQHARPTQGPSQMTSVPSKELTSGDKAQRLGAMVQQLVSKKARTQN